MNGGKVKWKKSSEREKLRRKTLAQKKGRERGFLNKDKTHYLDACTQNVRTEANVRMTFLRGGKEVKDGTGWNS